ncbi:MAG: DUF3568 family protein [Sedimentisphaerales bacterium]
MLSKKMLLICLEVALIAAGLGCAPAIVSPDAGVYQNGKLYAMSSRDIDTVYAATLAAMDKLQLQVTEKMKDVFSAKVIAKSADGKIIVVKIKPEAGNKTAYEIKVGAFGNEEMSRKIYDEIVACIAIVKTK